ncbi:GNAT family N-acetyltransferase, partial [Saprospiraceae bacterium]|nr:GNAT family N-acetyltransferase [Saprospiraceae bacterium]
TNLLETWTTGEMTEEFVEQVLANYYVAIVNSEVVATGALDLKSGQIDAMSVHPSHMRTGLGRQMLSHLEKLANESGLVRLKLDSTLNAAPFYRACGFVGNTFGEYKSPRGITLDCIPMTKWLDTASMIKREFEIRDGHKLLVKEAEGAEAAPIIKYVNEVAGQTDFLSFGANELGLSESDEQRFLEKCLESNNQLFLVGWINGSVVSTLSFHGGQRPRLRHAGEFGMSVDREFWGLGIGSFMVDVMINWAKSHQAITKINLRVRTDNDRAIKLYQRKGFSIEGTIRNDMLINGEYFDHHWMGSELI